MTHCDRRMGGCGNMSVEVKYSVLFMAWREPRYLFPVFKKKKKGQMTPIFYFCKRWIIFICKGFCFQVFNFVILPYRSQHTYQNQFSAKNTKFAMSLLLMQIFSFHSTFTSLKYWAIPLSCFEFCFEFCLPPFVHCIYSVCLFRFLNTSFSSYD